MAMHKLLLLAGAAMIAAATPAAAQYGYSFYQDRIGRLADRLETGIRDGRIVGGEAQRLRWELRNLRLLERQHSGGGLSRAEREELQLRIEGLDRRIRQAIRNPYHRDPRWDRDNDGRDDRYEDDRGYDRDGRQDGDLYDRDGRYGDDRYDDDRDDDDRYDRTDGDRWDDDRRDPAYGGGRSGFRVGDTLPPTYNQYNVPLEYYREYRDNAYYIYRYDGRAIYEVDRRNGRITRVIEAR
jgi:hypothetical protein